MRLQVAVIWTQWRVGVWWWPVKKDRAIGAQIGPLNVWLETP